MKTETIGLATLHLGDSREVSIAAGAVDMIFTDPPYGHNNNNGDLIHRRADPLPMMGQSKLPR